MCPPRACVSQVGKVFSSTFSGGNLKDVVGRSRSLDDFEFKGKKSNVSDQMKPEDVLLFQEPSLDSRRGTPVAVDEGLEALRLSVQ